MLIPLNELVQAHQMKIGGVLHVGAHEGEEAEAYRDNHAGPVWWVEADPQVIPRLLRRLRRFRDHHVIQTVVTDIDRGTVTFNRANNFQSSSVLQLGTHRRVSPDVHFVGEEELATRTIDSLVAEHEIEANFLNLDIQGAELLALMGGRQFLERQVDYIYTEINVDELYRGCVRLHELDEYLEAVFVRCDTRMAGNAGWGDALYVRKGIRP